MTAEQAGRPPVEEVIPAGKRIPADPRHAPGRVSLLNERRKDYDAFPHVIPDLFPVGLTIIVARGGVGKTTLSDQFALCVAGGVEIGGYKPDTLGWALAIDREGTTDRAVDRSIRAAPWLSMPTDEAGDPDDRIVYDCEFPGEFYEDRLAELEKRLIEAQAQRRPLRYIQIDPMRAFLGPVPRHMNTAQVDSDRLIPLNKLGQRYDCAIVVIAHVNKQGEFSGSEAIRGSCNAMWRLDREITGTEGKLFCLKTRAVKERNWPLTYDRDLGVWSVDETITPAQACKKGHQRALLDHIAEYGPTLGGELCAAVVASTGATLNTIKNGLSLLARDGYVIRSRDGLWSINSAPVAACEVCRRPMTVVQPGQTTHPNCAPSGPPPLPWGDGVPADAWLDKTAAPVAEDEGGQLAEVIQLPTPPAAEDQADEPERWPAVQELTRSIEAVRPRPVKWIAKEGDPRGQGDGRQHRGLPQWEAARQADRTVGTGYSKRWKPAGLDQADPARLVATFDKTQAYVSSSGTVPVSRDLLQHFGTFDCDPRDLGAPSPRKDGRPAGLAGIVQVEAPAWEHTGMPHPLGPKAIPGELLAIPSNMLEFLWRLHRDEAISRPVVRDSWLAARHTGVFTQFANAVRDARAAAVHDSPEDRAIKTSSNRVISMLRSEDRGAGLHRPDWHAAIAGESMIRIWIRAWSAVQAGGELAGIGTVDETSWLIPANTDPVSWLPAGYKPGGKWGDMRPKAVQIKPGADLTGIDPARITPATGHPGHVLVSGPIPLGLWVNRA